MESRRDGAKTFFMQELIASEETPTTSPFPSLSVHLPASSHSQSPAPSAPSSTLSHACCPDRTKQPSGSSPSHPKNPPGAAPTQPVPNRPQDSPGPAPWPTRTAKAPPSSSCGPYSSYPHPVPFERTLYAWVASPGAISSSPADRPPAAAAACPAPRCWNSTPGPFRCRTPELHRQDCEPGPGPRPPAEISAHPIRSPGRRSC